MDARCMQQSLCCDFTPHRATPSLPCCSSVVPVKRIAIKTIMTNQLQTRRTRDTGRLDLQRVGTKAALCWPQKHNVLGVNVSAVTYAALADTLIEAAQNHLSAIVDFSPVDIIIQANRDD